MKLIVGLGNFGEEYKKTHHNMGFITLEEFCEREGIKITKSKCSSKIFEGNLYGEKVVLAEPQTYMNNSGIAVSELKQAFKPDKIMVIYDDVDLPIGTMRYRLSGSAGTHNGMKSIINLLDNQDFERIRIGIKPEKEIYDLADYVLSKISNDEFEKIYPAIEDAIEILGKWIKNEKIEPKTSKNA